MQLTRQQQMKKAEKARRLLRKIEWRLQELRFLPNNEEMEPKIFSMILQTNEDMRSRNEILELRKEKIKRIIWDNA